MTDEKIIIKLELDDKVEHTLKVPSNIKVKDLIIQVKNGLNLPTLDEEYLVKKTDRKKLNDDRTLSEEGVLNGNTLIFLQKGKQIILVKNMDENIIVKCELNDGVEHKIKVPSNMKVKDLISQIKEYLNLPDLDERNLIKKVDKSKLIGGKSLIEEGVCNGDTLILIQKKKLVIKHWNTSKMFIVIPVAFMISCVIFFGIKFLSTETLVQDDVPSEFDIEEQAVPQKIIDEEEKDHVAKNNTSSGSDIEEQANPQKTVNVVKPNDDAASLDYKNILQKIFDANDVCELRNIKEEKVNKFINDYQGNEYIAVIQHEWDQKYNKLEREGKIKFQELLKKIKNIKQIKAVHKLAAQFRKENMCSDSLGDLDIFVKIRIDKINALISSNYELIAREINAAGTINQLRSIQEKVNKFIKDYPGNEHIIVLKNQWDNKHIELKGEEKIKLASFIQKINKVKQIDVVYELAAQFRKKNMHSDLLGKMEESVKLRVNTINALISSNYELLAREISVADNVNQLRSFQEKINIFNKDYPDNEYIAILEDILKQKNHSLQVTLRSSYSKLSVKEIRTMPHITILKKRLNGFYGHSTIINSYEEKEIKRDQVVLNHITGLMWLAFGSNERLSFKEAEKWVQNLNNKGYAGYNDWRLPTAEEAASLLESEKNDRELYIDLSLESFKPNMWTGDRNAAGGVWCVNFLKGSVSLITPYNKQYVCPVRAER